MESLPLRQLQELPLYKKVDISSKIIEDWYSAWDGDVYVSFSGGKDSTVLLNMVRRLYPDVEGVFIDTGLEYPEIRSFVKRTDNIIWIRPSMRFVDIINKYGYPVVSKEVAHKVHMFRHAKTQSCRKRILYGNSKGNWKIPDKWRWLLDLDIKISNKCCNYLKKQPIKRFNRKYGKVPFLGMMAADSSLRANRFRSAECNNYDTKSPTSNPLYFWTDVDIWEYIRRNNVSYSSIYDMGYKHTGCMFCMFGVHLEKQPNKFQLMSRTHPKQYDFCINKLGLGYVMDKLNIQYRSM